MRRGRRFCVDDLVVVVGRLRTKLVLQGANIPFTAGAEKTLHERGILVIPDFIANAGGVICAAMELRRRDRVAGFPVIAEKIRSDTEVVLNESKGKHVLPRQAAVDLAGARVKEAMSYRRF